MQVYDAMGQSMSYWLECLMNSIVIILRLWMKMFLLHRFLEFLSPATSSFLPLLCGIYPCSCYKLHIHCLCVSVLRKGLGTCGEWDNTNNGGFLETFSYSLVISCSPETTNTF